MEHIVYFVRIDGSVISLPADTRADAADIVIAMVQAHLREDEDAAANVVTEEDDDVLIVMTGIAADPTCAFVAAPATYDLIEIMRQYISPELTARDFNFVSLNELHDPNISIH